MADEKLPLTLHSGSGLVQIGPQGGRILAEMVNGALALSRTAESSGALTRRFRIGAHELCEPDYQQILLWTKALELEPETVIERLLADQKGQPRQDLVTLILNGRIIKLGWDMHLLPLVSFEWVEGLIIESIHLFGRTQQSSAERNLSLSLPELRCLSISYMGFSRFDLSAVPLLTSLSCSENQLIELDLPAVPLLTKLHCRDNQLSKLELSAVPLLTELDCSRNELIELDLSAVPMLTSLYCYNNQLIELDLPAIPLLTELYCSNNQLTELELSAVPLLTELGCSGNELTELDLSAVPLLTELYCRDNQLSELDISPLWDLTDLSYDEDETHLIQRPDQNF